MAAPMPLDAPVTTATLPEFAHVFFLFCVWSPQLLKAEIRASTTRFLA
jgi:hypothetical protein